jgi:hypothetical protein
LTDTRNEREERRASGDVRDAREFRSLSGTRLEHAVPVAEPLVLVSQIQRSGGTLLSRLFDGHPECHAHPQELKIGHPKKRHWPRLDVSHPETWFDVLHEKHVVKYRKRGYWSSQPASDTDRSPFLFSLRLQRVIFEAHVAKRRVRGDRDVLDCYFTSYFNAWLDNHNLYTGPKKVVTGFVPRLAMDRANVERFFTAYPDGTLISVVRDPRGWYVSARRHRDRYDDVESALRLWQRSATAALEAREQHPERVLVVLYEDLVRNTEAVMRRLADRIGITMSPTLLVPTFNGRPVRANSANVEGQGVLPERADAWRDELDRSTTARIDELAGDLYERASDAARTA